VQQFISARQPTRGQLWPEPSMLRLGRAKQAACAAARVSPSIPNRAGSALFAHQVFPFLSSLEWAFLLLCPSGSYMGDVCVWDTLTGSFIASRASVHTGPVRAIDMRRRNDGMWMLCSGGEDWRVCVSSFRTHVLADAATGCDIPLTCAWFTIDCRVRCVCIDPWIDDCSLCIVGSQTGRVFSFSLNTPHRPISNLPLDSPDIDSIACSPDFIFCCGRNGSVLRLPAAALTSSQSVSVMHQLPLAPALPPVTSLCIDSTRLRIVCLHGPSIISERPLSNSDPSQLRIISNDIWASASSTTTPPLLPSSTSCLAADAGFVVTFGCRGDAALIRDNRSLQLVTQSADSDRFYLCCCRLQDDAVLSACAIRSNGTIYGFRADDAARGNVSAAEFGVRNRLGRCSALECTAVGANDLVVCAGSIAGTLVLFFGPTKCDAVDVVAGRACLGADNAVLILKKLHGVKPVSCIHLKNVAPSGGTYTDAYSLLLYSAGHDGCIISTHLRLHRVRGTCHVVAQQRVRNFDSAPIVAFSLCSSENARSSDAQVSCTSILSGRVLHSFGSFPLLAPPTAVGIIDQHRFSSLSAVCTATTILLADVCKGQVRAMAADAIAGCYRIVPGIHTDTINDIAFVCYGNAERVPGDSGHAILCTVSTDGCCCICSIPASSDFSSPSFQVLSRLYAHAHQIAGSALMCVKVLWLGNHHALIVAGGAFSCVHIWVLFFDPPDVGGCSRVTAISHASHMCNSCDDEGKCVSALHCNTEDFVNTETGFDGVNCRIWACLNDGRVAYLSCVISGEGAISMLPAVQSHPRLSHAILCVAADSQGKLLFGLSNGCLQFTDVAKPHNPKFTTNISSRCALHVAGLNAILPLDRGVIATGGEDGCLSLVSFDVDGRVRIHQTRRVSDGAVKKLLLLRCSPEVAGCNIEADIGVICHNQRCLVASVQVQCTSARSDAGSCDKSRDRNGSLACLAQVKSISADIILDVGKSWSACILGTAREDKGTKTQVAIGGWGVQVIRM
jgi:hypothetical protein